MCVHSSISIIGLAELLFNRVTITEEEESSRKEEEYLFKENAQGTYCSTASARVRSHPLGDQNRGWTRQGKGSRSRKGRNKKSTTIQC